MSEFSELIKNFDKIRDYMRDFYVYGFKTREEFSKKSLRSYDNEKRRIECYLNEYMVFNQGENGKNVLISVDSGKIASNPIYRAFKAKTFTKNDISLHFIILDILSGGNAFSANEIAEIISVEYSSHFDVPLILDLSTIRNKLNEYVKLGFLKNEKEGRKLIYSLVDETVDLTTLKELIMFFSEICPLGVVGSFLNDKFSCKNQLFSFKHHYIMHALESEVLYLLLTAMDEQRKVEITNHSQRTGATVKIEVIPLKILVSVQGGRRYLSAYNTKVKTISNYRLDYINSVKLLDVSPNFNALSENLNQMLNFTWGTVFKQGKELEHFEMKIFVGENEEYIIHRINREGRHGKLSQIDETTFLFSIDVYDTMEMMPWVRTFIGRIVSIECTNEDFEKTLYNDFYETFALYKGEC